MSAGKEVETGRTSVKTYVPEYQKEIWTEHAAQLGMSQSEFVRTMVQAGRRGFELVASQSDTSTDTVEGHPTGATPGVEGLETRLLDILSTDTYLSWDELVEALENDFEDRLEESLNELQQRNEVQHSGRHGGYTIASE